MKQEELVKGNETGAFQTPGLQRRRFLTQLGIGAAAATGLVSCMKSVSSNPVVANNKANTTADDQITDTWILNYAYLLEQLESAFYIMVTDKFYKHAGDTEKRRLQEIRDHEIAHREFFKTALGSAAVGEQEFDFSSIDFTDRHSVLYSAKTFEDTGVSAYNGIGYSLRNPDYLAVAGKIVSVEARHASYLRDLVKPVSFADDTVIDANGLDLAAKPATVIAAITPYFPNGWPI